MKQTSTAISEVKSEGKVTAFFQRIGKRNLIIACSVLLIGAAVWLNWMLFSSPDTGDGYDGYDKPSGSVSDDLGGGSSTVDEDSYFSATQVSRQKARDEALEVLQAVVDNEDATEELKNEALASISQIAETGCESSGKFFPSCLFLDRSQFDNFFNTDIYRTVGNQTVISSFSSLIRFNLFNHII